MLEIAIFIAAIVYAFTLPGRIQRVKSGNLPPKFANDPAKYEKRVRSESKVLMICAGIWAVKDLVEVLFLHDAETLGSGGMALVWLFVLGWIAVAIGLYMVRRPLEA